MVGKRKVTREQVIEEVERLLAGRADLDQEIANLNQQKEAINEEALALMTDYGIATLDMVLGDGTWRRAAIRQTKGKDRIDRQLLVERGVSIEVVEASTVLGKLGKEWLDIRRISDPVGG